MAPGACGRRTGDSAGDQLLCAAAEAGVPISAGLPKVGVVIPCYCARGEVGEVVKEVLEVAKQLADHCDLTILVVKDACPKESWREITHHPQVEVLHHAQNRGVGAATLTGLKAGLAYMCQAMMKLDTSLLALLPVGLLTAGALMPPAARGTLLVGAVSSLQRNALLPMLWLQAACNRRAWHSAAVGVALMVLAASSSLQMGYVASYIFHNYGFCSLERVSKGL